MWSQAAEQSGSRFDRAASSREHAAVAVGPGVGQVPAGQLPTDATGESSRNFVLRPGFHFESFADRF